MRGWIGLTLLLCAITPAKAENWVQVADSPIEGMESCVDADSLKPGQDGKTEFHAKLCGFDKLDTYRSDCRKDAAGAFAYETLKDGAFHAGMARPTSPVGESIAWVCAKR